MPPIDNAMPDLDRQLEFQPTANDDPVHLDLRQIHQFNQEGYLFPLDVFSAEEAVANRDYLDELMTRSAARGWDAYAINGWHKHCAGIHDLVTEPRILDYVQEILGEDLICWGTHYFCKLPGDTRQVSWHQDASYWPLTPSRTVTVWLAIDDAALDNGPMTVIPGSHRRGQIPFDRSAPEEDNVLNQTVSSPDSYGGAPVPFVLKAGQISLHSDLLLHGSQPNRSDRRRCGLTMRFVPPEVRAYSGWNRNAVICRGADASGHWAHNPRPEGDTIPARE